MPKNRAGGIVIENNKLLLIHRIKDGQEFYVFPGGGVEEGESYEQAVVREMEEELGVKVRIRRYCSQVELEDKGEQKTEKYYYLEILEGQPELNEQDQISHRMQASKGTNYYELVWIDISELHNLTIYPVAIKQKLIKQYSSPEPIFDNAVPFREFFFRAVGYDTPFSLFDSAKVKQSYGIVLDENNRLLLVKHQRGDYLLPGGSVEAGETIMQTLNRELMEEAAVILDQASIRDGFWQEIYLPDANKEWKLDTLQVRFCARVKEKLKFESDPDVSIIGQEWIEIDDLSKYLDWGAANEAIQQVARQYIDEEL